MLPVIGLYHTVQIGYLCQALLHTIRDNTPTQGIMQDELLHTTTGQAQNSRSRSQSHSHRYQSHNCNNSHRSNSRSHHRWHHRSTSQHHHPNTYRYCCDTQHQRSSSCRGSLTHSRDCSISRSHTSYKPSRNTLSKSSSSSSQTTVKAKDKMQRRVMIDNPQSDYYSSDDTFSDSEDDSK